MKTRALLAIFIGLLINAHARTSHTPNAPIAAAWALKSRGLDASAYEPLIENKGILRRGPRDYPTNIL